MQSNKAETVTTIEGESHPPRSWKERIALLIAVLIAIIVWLWSSKKQAAEEEAAVVVSVRVAKAERDSIAAEVTALGTIFPRHEATVSSKIPGQLKQVALLKNKAVREGEVIATLESRDIQAQRA